jgi:hypothetical protein
MRSLLLVSITLGLALAALPAAAAQDCQAKRCAARAAIEAACPCDKATDHGAYVSCVAQTARQVVGREAGAAMCVGEVVRCAAQSTCGKSGAVTCQKGPRCRIVNSAERCTDSGGRVGTSKSCCPDCPSGS